MSHHHYTSEEKRRILDRLSSGESATSIIKSSCIPKSTLYKCRAEANAEKNTAVISLQEYRTLQNRLERANYNYYFSFVNKPFVRNISISYNGQRLQKFEHKNSESI